MNKIGVLLGRRKGQGWIFGRHPTMSASGVTLITEI